MEQLLNLKYINNLFNINYDSREESKIIKLEIIKNKVALLLSTYELILYDTNNENFIKKRFNESNEIDIIVYYENLFIIQNKLIFLLDSNTLEKKKSWLIDEDFYYFTFYGEYNSLNIEIIYVNYNHEIKFYSKSYLSEKEIRNLYKENQKIDKILYQNGYLIWSSNLTLKLFNLEHKKMIIRKNYKNLVKQENETTSFFLLNDNYLCVNIGGKAIFIYNILENNYAEEIFRVESYNDSEKYLGFWLNSSLTKISIIKSIAILDNSSIYLKNSIELQIYKINSKENKNDLLFKKDFTNVITYGEFKFSICQTHSNVYIYDEKEFYFFTVIDKFTKVLDELKVNKNIIQNFNDICLILNRSNNINEKLFITNKLIRNMNTLLNSETIDSSKILSILNAMMSYKVLVNDIILLLIMSNNFEVCYFWINKSFKNLKAETIYLIIKHLVDNKKYDLAITFLNEIEEIKENGKLLDYLKLLEENCTEDKIIFICATIELKIGNYENSIRLFYKIFKNNNNHVEQKVFDILIDNNELLILKCHFLLESLDNEKLLEILDNIYNKDLDLSNCDQFYQIFINSNIDNKFTKFIERVIEKSKFYLVVNSEIAEIFFDHLIKENSVFILSFITNYDKLDFTKTLTNYSHILNEDNFINLNPSNQQMFIQLLNYTNQYERVINIYIEKLNDPDKSINYIESISNDKEKESLYNILKQKIQCSNYLSPIKKFYFIALFQDDECYGTDYLNELFTSEKEDDLKYIFLILQQFKLKQNILELTLTISKKQLCKMLKLIKKETSRGANIKLHKLKCSFNNCEDRSIKMGDELVCFVNCFHIFHKFCFEKDQIPNEGMLIKLKSVCKICSKTQLY